MLLIEKGVTGIAAFCILLGAFFLVQGTDLPEPRAVRKADQPTAATVNSVTMSRARTDGAVFGFPDTKQVPRGGGPLDDAVILIDETLVEQGAPRAQFVQRSPVDKCRSTLDATRELAAIVTLRLSSPCHPEADFVIWHADMAFSLRTDDTGAATVRTPALAVDAIFVATYRNIEEAHTSLKVPDVTRFDRVALHWRGRHNVQLHALEDGATFGDPGHIWSASTQNTTRAHQGERGFMMRLGTTQADLPYLTEIYTFPFGSNNRTDDVSLRVGVAITADNCGRELDLVGLQTNAGQATLAERLKIELLPCDQVGQSVMREGLFDNLILASG
ncbi:hypothetical protein [Yoonia sp. 2307UL14-13]|uniref:hypothetical protein n=1 Tax=Yoonia sp. 2307UL14-13 TaxID=3126506 RepID=UPI0030951DB7